MKELAALCSTIMAVYSVMSPDDKSSCDNMGYLVIKQPGQGRTWQNASSKQVRGLPTVETIMEIVSGLPTGKYQAVWYPFGGKSQELRAPIKRIEFYYESKVHDGAVDDSTGILDGDVESMESHQVVIRRDGSDERGMTIVERVNESTLQGIRRNVDQQSAFFEEALGRLMDGFGAVISTQAAHYDKMYARIMTREERLERAVAEERAEMRTGMQSLHKMMLKHSEATLGRAQTMMDKADTLDQNARIRGGKAQDEMAKVSSKERRLKELQAHLELQMEQGNEEGIMGLIGKLGQTEQGSTFVATAGIKILEILEGLFNGKGSGEVNDRVKKMGGVDTVANILRLSEEQRTKLKGLMGE